MAYFDDCMLSTFHDIHHKILNAALSSWQIKLSFPRPRTGVTFRLRYLISEAADFHFLRKSAEISMLVLTCAFMIFGTICSTPSFAKQISSVEKCSNLVMDDLSTLPEAPTTITAATVIPDGADFVSKLGETLHYFDRAKLTGAFRNLKPFCRLKGYVAPSVGFEMLLPMNGWNGKLLHVGCGGWCGTTAYVAILCALHNNYACIGTDMGHQVDGGMWFRNNLQAQIDFSYRATHVATIAGKEIVSRFYARPPHFSYFMGCSTGGYQGMVEAQRYPWDFNGIIAGAPDMDESDLAVRSLWMKKNFFGPSGRPVLSSSDIALLHSASIASCDMDDGVKDGIISAPYNCNLELNKLKCSIKRSNGCLHPDQLRAAANIYGAPRTSHGLTLSSRGVFPGSELGWATSFSHPWGEEFFKETGLLSTANRSWSYLNFDFDYDYKRSGVGVLFSDTNPDLRRFKAAGGKLLSYQGDNDTDEIPGAVFDYYGTVEHTMGGRAATQNFYRLFSIPGMNHCGGGIGAFSFNFLAYLEEWVEHGRAPDVMVGAHVKDLKGYNEQLLWEARPDKRGVTFTRPVYPFPLHARFKGTGDSNKAENFEPSL